MNTSIFDRNATIAICVLSVWLPLTTLAQDVPKASDHTGSADVRVENCTHCQTAHASLDIPYCWRSIDTRAPLPGSGRVESDMSVGFAETDPADQDSREFPSSLRQSAARTPELPVGFAEVDPAAHTTAYGLPVPKTTLDGVQQSYAGFAESDPTDIQEQASEEIQTPLLVVCPHDGDSCISQGIHEFPGRNGHRHCHKHT